MAKKFGKFLLFTAAVGAAATAAYYFMQKKDISLTGLTEEDDDYDDFYEDLDDLDNTRSYVSLNRDTTPVVEEDENETGDEGFFTPLAEQVSEVIEEQVEDSEEFFDEDDASDEEPPITDV